MDMQASNSERSRKDEVAEDGSTNKPQKNSVESEAASLFQRGLYHDAVKAYSDCLARLGSATSKAVHIGLLFNRSAAHLKLVSIPLCNLLCKI